MSDQPWRMAAMAAGSVPFWVLPLPLRPKKMALGETLPKGMGRSWASTTDGLGSCTTT